MRIPSTKLARMVECESILEGEVALLLEHSPGVVSYQEQPIRIQYWDGDGMREYFPDFEVILLDGSRIHIEVKHTRDLARPKIAAKFRAIAAHYQKTPIQFRIITEQECRREPLRTNIRRLNYLRVKATGRPFPSLAQLFHLLGQQSVPLAFAEEALGAEAVQRLLAFGLLHCDLTQQMTEETPITVAEGGRHATVLL